MLCRTWVRPHLIFCSVVWNCKSDLHALPHWTQNKAQSYPQYPNPNIRFDQWLENIKKPVWHTRLSFSNDFSNWENSALTVLTFKNHQILLRWTVNTSCFPWWKFNARNPSALYLRNETRFKRMHPPHMVLTVDHCNHSNKLFQPIDG